MNGFIGTKLALGTTGRAAAPVFRVNALLRSKNKNKTAVSTYIASCWNDLDHARRSQHVCYGLSVSLLC